MTDIVTADIDAEQIIIGFLLDADLPAELDDRVYTELPANASFPATRVRQFNDIEVSGPALWLVRYSLQVDVWGGPKKLTRSIASSLRSLFKYDLPGVQGDAVITHVVTGGLDTTPDGTYQPAKPRARFDLNLWAHPASDLGS